jgi:FkbM family methyltransferase
MLRDIVKIKEFFVCAVAIGRTPLDALSIFWKETKNVRVRLGLARHHPDRIYALDTKYGRLHFRDNYGDITNLLGLFYHKVYDTPLTASGAIFDIGANIGLAAAWFAHAHPDRRIFCFEPLEGNASMIALNSPGAVVRQAAVGAQPGRVTLRVDGHGTMASSVSRPVDTREVEFEVIALDDFVATEKVDRIALLKLDVEGMEEEILRGAPETLARSERVILESHGSVLHERVIDLLERAGFRIDWDEFDGRTGFVKASREGGGRERPARA